MYKILNTLLSFCLHLQGSEGVPQPPGADVSVSFVTQEPLPGPGPVCGGQPSLTQPHSLGRDHGHSLVWLQLPVREYHHKKYPKSVCQDRFSSPVVPVAPRFVVYEHIVIVVTSQRPLSPVYQPR